MSAPNKGRIRKRNRVPLSCRACHRRKIKCNRELPCQNCIVRNEVWTCSYVAPSDSSRQKQAAHNRQGKDNSQNTEAPALTAAGAIFNDQYDTYYRGATHWGSVVDELTEPDLVAVTLGSSSNGSESSEGSRENIQGTRKSALESVVELPLRAVADRLALSFFDTQGPTGLWLHVVHRPTFLSNYAKFWRAPDGLPKSWIGLLFSILSLSLQARVGWFDDIVDPSNYHDFVTRWRSIAVSCSQTRDNSLKGAQYSLQTKLLVSIGIALSPDCDGKDFSTSIGVVTRDAIHMGFHRDPSRSRSIRVFDGEIRRRLWALVKQMDTLSSFHMGLPCSIRSAETDTREPLNIADDQLLEDMGELPEPVPFSPDIPIGYMIVKSRICEVLGRIVEHLNSLSTGTYDQALQIQRDLEAVYTSIPLHFQFTSWDEASEAPPTLFVQRIHLNLLFHQGICALHRKYLPLSFTVNGHAYRASRDACQESALVLLSHQACLFRELKPGGVVKPSHGRSIRPASENFGLAAAILCLCLQRIDASAPEEMEKRGDIIRTLRISRDIYAELVGESETAKRLSKILTYALSKALRADGDGNLPLEQGQDFPAVDLTGKNSDEPRNQTTTQDDLIGFSLDENVDFSGVLDPDWSEHFNWGLWDSVMREAEELPWVDNPSVL